MDIEILKADKMVNVGHYVLKALKGSTSLLDLLVRESIQNSLDAGKNAGGISVRVDYYIDEFDRQQLDDNLEVIGSSLDQRFTEKKYKFIAIKDRGTTGLTGKYRKKDMIGNDKGNFYKLVYSFGENQTESGAGGAWGVGKTIYSRIGIGLVFYYSRIQNENGKFESRLVGCMIENEKAKNSIIPAYEGSAKSGIAWWGKKEDPNEDETVPITDEKEINEFLKIFGLKPFDDEVTGTVVIIPYVDEEKLLNNKWIEDDENSEKPFWRNSIEEFIRIAVQRWYYPRLFNMNFKYGKFLKVAINDELLQIEDMEPIFRIMRSLYNRAARGSNDNYDKDDYIRLHKLESFTKTVAVRKDLEDTCAGYVSAVKVTSRQLGMLPPDNNYSPYVYFDEPMAANDENTPLLAFCRQPGMIVAYAQRNSKGGEWLNNVPTTKENEYILSQFVLNSRNDLNLGISLEEYVRSCEEEDHYAWNDKTIESHNFDLPDSFKKKMDGVDVSVIDRIKKNTAKALKGLYEIRDIAEGEEVSDGGLGMPLASVLLPPTGYGEAASGKEEKPAPTPGKKKNKPFTAQLISREFQKDGMLLTYNITMAAEREDFKVSVNISSEAGDITPSMYEDSMLLKMPFEVISSALCIKQMDGKDISAQNVVYLLDSDKEIDKINNDMLKASLQYTDYPTSYGAEYNFYMNHDLEMMLMLKLRMDSKDVRPHVVFG